MHTREKEKTSLTVDNKWEAHLSGEGRRRFSLAKLIGRLLYERTKSFFQGFSFIHFFAQCILLDSKVRINKY